MPNTLCHLLATILLIAMLPIVAAAQSEQPPDLPNPYGIWIHKDTILLFAPFRQCENEPYQPMQTLISKDGGKNWSKSGPRFEGRSLMYLLDTGNELWFAGEYYAEGPTSSPFLLRFDPDDEWPEFSMYEDGADLQAIAQDERNPHRFLAWIAHLTIEDPEAMPVFLHRSLDGGESWNELQEVKRVPRSWKGFRFFQEPPRETKNWRLNNFIGPGVSALEHLEADGKWREVTRLPLAIQNTCGD